MDSDLTGLAQTCVLHLFSRTYREKEVCRLIIEAVKLKSNNSDRVNSETDCRGNNASDYSHRHSVAL